MNNFDNFMISSWLKVCLGTWNDIFLWLSSSFLLCVVISEGEQSFGKSFVINLLSSEKSYIL
jgi:hypothetical protein